MFLGYINLFFIMKEENKYIKLVNKFDVFVNLILEIFGKIGNELIFFDILFRNINFNNVLVILF